MRVLLAAQELAAAQEGSAMLGIMAPGLLLALEREKQP